MTYRSDLDAAHARIAALEAENARLANDGAARDSEEELAAEVARLRRSEARRSRAPLVFGLAMGVASILGAVGVFVALTSEPERPMTRRDRPVAVDIDLRACANQLARSPHASNDLDGRSVSMETLERTTGCRDEIQEVLDHGVISGLERIALGRWLHAEDELANQVSLITTYHANDPYALDQYRSLPQLWREYDRAYERREAALEEWRHAAD